MDAITTNVVKGAADLTTADVIVKSDGDGTVSETAITETELGYSADAVQGQSSLLVGDVGEVVTVSAAGEVGPSGVTLGTIASQDAAAVAITGGSISGITDLAVADGGTGASDAAGARTNLGLGTMATEAAADYLAVSSNLSDLLSAATARTNLGLGTLATADTGDYWERSATATWTGEHEWDGGGTPSAPAADEVKIGNGLGRFGAGIDCPLGDATSQGFGYQALNSNTGDENTAAGYQALYSCTSGKYNTATGYQALYACTTANFNTAHGWTALSTLTTGTLNAGFGTNALKDLTTGDDNTAAGTNALLNLTTGSDNIAIGYTAASTINAGSAAEELTNGVYIGANTSASATDADNEIVIGYDAEGAGDDTVQIGNTSIVATYLEGGVRVGTGTSDPASPTDGMLFYRTDTNKLRLRAGGSWVDLN